MYFVSAICFLLISFHVRRQNYDEENEFDDNGGVENEGKLVVIQLNSLFQKEDFFTSFFVNAFIQDLICLFLRSHI